LSNLDARLAQSDIAAIANEQAEANFPPNPVAKIVADDGANRRSSNDLIDIQMPGLAGVDGCGNEDRLAGQRQSHALKADHASHGQASHIS